MTELPFASQCDRFSGQEGWVVGRGPTRFRYEDLARGQGPVFFINDAVGQERWLAADRPAFFFAHDAAMECWLFREPLRSVPVLITDQPVTGPLERRKPGLISGTGDPRLARLGPAVFYRRNGPLDRSSLLTRTREEIAGSGQLHTAGGTIHPLLHFAWYVGCAQLRLVGCDGLPGVGYDGRLENRSHSSQQGALTIRVQQEEILRQLGLPHEYLGTLPHRLAMTMLLPVSREHHGSFLAWAEALVSRFRALGCGELAVRDRVGQAKGYWIKGVWPAIDPCVECLASPWYAEMTRGALRPFLRDPGAGLQVAYKALI